MKRRILSLVLALAMLLGLFTLPAAAGNVSHDAQVRVIVENNTFPKSEGAPWEGTLVDTWVDIDDNSTMMGCIGNALTAYESEGIDSGYISSINGLSAFDGGAMSGWMGTLNDWFTNEGFDGFTVKNGKLEAGDEIRVQYTCEMMGADLGAEYGGTDKTVKALAFSAGMLSPAFDKDTHSYTLTVPADTQEIMVTPTASNKNFQIHTTVGTKEYKRTAGIPAANGSVITVTCGDKAWPSMNDNSGEAQVYTVTVSTGADTEKPSETVCPHETMNNGVCADCGAIEYTLQIVPETASVSFGGEKLTDNGIQTISNKNYHIYTLTAKPETPVTYSGTDGEYDLGSGTLTLAAASTTYRLVRHNFYASIAMGMEDWDITAFTDKTSSQSYTLGKKFDDNGIAKQLGLLIAGHKYGAEFEMAESFAENYYASAFSDFTVSASASSASNKTLPINAYKTFKLTVPSDAEKVEFFEQTANYVVKAMNTAEMTTTDNGDGTTTYLFKSKSTTFGFQHMWRVSKAGETTQAGFMGNSKDITVSWSEHKPSETENYPKDANFNYDDNSVLLNIDDSKDTNELAMQVGETFKLRAFRNGWEIISDVSGNRMIEPDFHYAILSGNDVISVAPVTDVLTGNASGNWMNITALSNGTAILAVWYDGIEITGSAQFDGFYGASNPARYGYVVVNVGEDATIAITPISQDGDWDAEFDTVYYADDNGGIFSFEASDVNSVTVTNLRGTVMGEAGSVTKSADGKWNVPVFDGSNLITLTSENGVDYRLIRAKKVTAHITNVTTGKTDADADFVIHVGDTVSVSLDKLDMPLPKMSGIYNPGFGGTCKMVYMIDGQYAQVSKGTQYNFPTPAVCTVTFVASKPGELHLGNGYITTGVFGSEPGAHRSLTDAGKPVNTNAPENSYCFGKLPELTLYVEDGSAVSYADMTELTSLNIHVGMFSGMSTTKYVEFKSAADSSAAWKSGTNANAYLSITAVPKMYYNTLSLTYWYEGETPVTVAVPSNNEFRIPVGDTWSVQTAKMLNLVFTITPGDGNTAEAKSYHYVIMGGMAKLQYVHPVMTALTVTDSEGDTLSLNQPVNYNDTAYVLNLGAGTYISLNASMLQQTISASANTADKADTVTVQRMANGQPIGEALTVAPADANAYPVGSWTLNDLDIASATTLEIKVTSYVDSTTRSYTVTLKRGVELTPAVNGGKAEASVDEAVEIEASKPLKIIAASAEAGVTETAVSIPAAVMQKLDKAESLELTTDLGTVAFDKDALTQMSGEKAVTFSMAKAEKPEALSDATGENVRYFEFGAKTEDAQNVFSETGAGSATVTLDYEAPAEGKQVNVYFVNGSTRIRVPASYANGKLTFTVTHFSTYEAQTEPKDVGYTVTADSVKSVIKGENAEIRYQIAGEDSYNAYHFVLNYDTSKLEYQSINLTDATVTNENGILTAAGYGADKTTALTVTFKALDTGTSTVTLSSAKIDLAANANTKDAPEATLINASSKVSATGYSVALPDGFTGAKTVMPNENYSFTPDNLNYDYTLSVTMGGAVVTPTLNEDGSYTVQNVTGALVILQTAKTGKSRTVTVDGAGADDVNADATATYADDYSFTLTEDPDYSYTLSVTINGIKFTGYTKSGNTYTISGTDLTGEIAITVTKTANTGTCTVTVIGTGADDVVLSTATATENTAFSFTLNKAEGYDYSVTVTVGGSDVTPTVSENSYTVAAEDVTGDITISVSKSVQLTVVVSEYVKLNEKSIWLVTAKPAVSLSEGQTVLYDGAAMYSSAKYDNAYAWAVIAADSATAETSAKAKLTVGAGTSAAVKYDSDVNQTGKVDVNDAQLVYNIYNAQYDSFDTVSVAKFLEADCTGDRTVNVSDAAFIVNDILSKAN